MKQQNFKCARPPLDEYYTPVFRIIVIEKKVWWSQATLQKGLAFTPLIVNFTPNTVILGFHDDDHIEFEGMQHFQTCTYKKLASPMISNFKLATRTRGERTSSRELYLSVFSIRWQFVFLP